MHSVTEFDPAKGFMMTDDAPLEVRIRRNNILGFSRDSRRFTLILVSFREN